MIAMNIAPGAQRPFSFEKLRFFDASQFKQLRDVSRESIGRLEPELLFGNDVNPSALDATSRHLQNIVGSELLKTIRLTNGRAEDIVRPAETGLVLSNPPYGERMDELADLRAWYPALGAWMKRELSGWTVCFITADRDMPSGLGFKPGKKTPLFNGALDCRLFEFQMYAGSKREPKTP
jgi:putative N6-adenine-specific DNA methylase